ncbi:MAG: peptide-methionine (S)-S-oxide reductase MsrA [Gemmatimonadaceae bacterium]
MACTSSAAAQTKASQSTLYLAGGCFWGVEAVFEHLRGVQSVTSGYARYGQPQSASHSPVRIETVRIVYDPARITHRQLLDVFFSVAHDPTTKDRQGPDIGPEYRAVVFYESDQDRQASEALRTELHASRRFTRPIVTEIQPLAAFAIAEEFHQNYAARNPNEPYIRINDAPKITRLKQQFPLLYQEQRAP